MKRQAKESFGGNVSAALAEAARWIRQREARHRLIRELGGPTLTRESSAAIDAEQRGRAPHEPRRARKKTAA